MQLQKMLEGDNKFLLYFENVVKLKSVRAAIWSQQPASTSADLLPGLNPPHPSTPPHICPLHTFPIPIHVFIMVLTFLLVLIFVLVIFLVLILILVFVFDIYCRKARVKYGAGRQ